FGIQRQIAAGRPGRRGVESISELFLDFDFAMGSDFPPRLVYHLHGLYDARSPELHPLLMIESETTQRQTPDSLMLFGFWYRALPSDQVTTRRLHKAQLLETPLAI